MKQKPERKVVLEITGDGLTAEEVAFVADQVKEFYGR